MLRWRSRHDWSGSSRPRGRKCAIRPTCHLARWGNNAVAPPHGSSSYSNNISKQYWHRMTVRCHDGYRAILSLLTIEVWHGLENEEERKRPYGVGTKRQHYGNLMAGSLGSVHGAGINRQVPPSEGGAGSSACRRVRLISWQGSEYVVPLGDVDNHFRLTRVRPVIDRP